jgi:hypothetical protein
MKLTTVTAVIAATFVCMQSAQAHAHSHRHHGHRVARSRAVSTSNMYTSFGAPFAPQAESFSAPQFGGQVRHAVFHGLGGRPAAWCGWAMRQLVGSDPGPSYNLARNWAHWGHAGPPGIGAVVVWPHHVGKIVGRENGQWVIESGNDGHALRTRPRSIAGAIAIRWS